MLGLVAAYIHLHCSIQSSHTHTLIIAVISQLSIRKPVFLFVLLLYVALTQSSSIRNLRFFQGADQKEISCLFNGIFNYIPFRSSFVVIYLGQFFPSLYSDPYPAGLASPKPFIWSSIISSSFQRRTNFSLAKIAVIIIIHMYGNTTTKIYSTRRS
jgi:hypothetical protein